MLSSSHIAEREADRAMIAEAMERFLAGNHSVEVEPGKTGVRDGTQIMRAFVEHPPRAEEKKRSQAEVRASINKATFASNQAHRKRRDLQAAKVAMHAGMGDSVSETARALELNRVTVRKIAKEHGITFNTQPQ